MNDYICWGWSYEHPKEVSGYNEHDAAETYCKENGLDECNIVPKEAVHRYITRLTLVDDHSFNEGGPR